jgi:tetratricopeptide (TPR) repeat protein
MFSPVPTSAPRQTVPDNPLGLPHPKDKIDHLSRAQELREVGDAKSALTEARKALFDHPDDLDTLEEAQADARAARNFSLEADVDEKLARLEPDDAYPLIRAARARVSRRDFDGAVADADQAVARDEGNAEAFQALGRARLGQGKLPEAIKAFDTAVELNPDQGYALNNLGYAYLLANRNVDAVQALTRARALLPSVAYVANNLGVALERTGDHEGALSAYDVATLLSPKYVKARVNLDRLRQVADARDSVPPSPEQADVSSPEVDDGDDLIADGPDSVPPAEATPPAQDAAPSGSDRPSDAPLGASPEDEP